LARAGAKKRPFYHIVIADSRMPRDGRFIERIGHYNPMVARDAEGRVHFDEARARHWLGVGAQPSDRVARFLGAAGITPARAVPRQTKKSQPKKKAQERMKAQEEARAKAAAAEPAPETAAEPVAETAGEGTAEADAKKAGGGETAS